MDRKQLLLYAVTDAGALKGISLKEAVTQALEGGATIVQLREKELDREEFRKEALEILQLCRKYGVPLIIDDDAELAAETGADGVHIGQDDMGATEARRILGGDKIIGVTAKTVEQAEKALADGADYLGSGAMFATSTKPLAKSITFDQLKEITGSVSIPVVAIGGITGENIMQLKGLGIAGAAVSAGIFGSADIKKSTAKLRSLVEKIV